MGAVAVAQIEVRRSTGKPNPATQMRRMLSASRRAGMSFEQAWESAFARAKWPHDTDARKDWKKRLEEDLPEWREAYERRGETKRSLAALYSLFTQVVGEEVEAA